MVVKTFLMVFVKAFVMVFVKAFVKGVRRSVRSLDIRRARRPVRH